MVDKDDGTEWCAEQGDATLQLITLLACNYLSSQGQTAVPGIRICATKTTSLRAAGMKGVTGRRVREAGNGLITNDKVVTNFKEGAYFF